MLGEGQAAVIVTPPTYTLFMDPSNWTWNFGESITEMPVRVTLLDFDR